MGGSSSGRRERSYQRRRRGPILIVVGVLAVAATITWTVVLSSAAGAAGVSACPPPTAGPSPGEPLPAGALDGVAPLPPSAVKVRVFNGGGQRMQANLVAAQFAELGFSKGGDPANDPFYPKGDMECAGQVRFGPAGEATASTVALVLPCTQLVRDGRPDDTVDVAVGTDFDDVNPDRSIRDALEELAAPSGGTDGSGNADPGANPDAPESGSPPTPIVDPAVLAEARAASC